jgi:L-arabinose isomerase
MISTASPEIWFLTGSQGLYGEEALRQVLKREFAAAVESFQKANLVP